MCICVLDRLLYLVMLDYSHMLQASNIWAASSETVRIFVLFLHQFGGFAFFFFFFFFFGFVPALIVDVGSAFP